MIKLFKKQKKGLSKLQKKRLLQQQQAYKALVGRTNSANYSYWESLITNCRVEKDIQLMELLDFHCVGYDLLKGGR